MRSKLTTIILIGMVLGILVGYACHILWPDPKTAKTIADYISLFTDIFLRLIKMIIAPLVFSTLVVGVAHMGDTKAVGRIGAKAMLWFVGASLVSLLVGMVLVNILRPGDNLNLPLPDAEASTNLKVASLSMKEFVAHLVPRSIVEAMATNEILQIVVFSLFFGVACAALGERTRKLVEGIEQLSQVILSITGYADRSVRVNGRDRDDPRPRHPRDLRQVRHRVLLRACRAVVLIDRRRLRDLRPP
jgi:Na+/H+-dicarboxylate symporter